VIKFHKVAFFYNCHVFLTASHCREATNSPKARKRCKTSLQSGMPINDSDMLTPSMRLITIEEPHNTILEPLKEVSETNLETPTKTKEKVEFANIPAIDIHSPTRSETRTRKKPAPEMMTPPAAIRPDILPITSMSSPPAPPAESRVAMSTPESAQSKENESVQEQPELRKMSEEKKRARRIRTNSRVETVL